MASKLHLELALTPDGWRRDVVVRIDHGVILGLEEPGHGEAQRVSGVVLPGLPNLHSHAFQRAMAGLTERRGSEADSFWTWREAMYRFVERLDARRTRGDRGLRLHGDARGGLHPGGGVPLSASPARRPALRQCRRDVGTDRGGGRQRRHRPHAPARALSPGRLLGQAAVAGAAALPQRSRFLCAADGDQGCPDGSIGIAPHSLRAVTLDDLQWAALTWHGRPAHIHVAEQTREVDDCLAAHGRRPVDLLLDTVEVDDRRWCLVHATHADAGEGARIAKAKASRRTLPDHRGQSRRRPVRRAGLAGATTGISASARIR